MKKKLHLALFLLASHLLQGQTGIGTLTPNPTAVLDVHSPNKGVLLPRIALVGTTDRTSIPNPPNSMFIYNTTSNNTITPGYYYWSESSTSWIKLLDETSGTGNWNTRGNAGTTPQTHFVGTTDDNDLVFKRNNRHAGRLGNTTLNTSFGTQSSESITSATGNTSIGHSSLKNNLTGNENTAIGTNALLSVTSGSRNIAIGSDALRFIQTNTENIAIGYRSIRTNTTGHNNVAIGTNALSLGNRVHNNVAIGNSALLNNNGTGNTAIGIEAAHQNTTGANNLAVGHYSLRNNTTGIHNTAIGFEALQHNTTGSRNTAIGYQAGPSSQNLSNTTSIGFQASATVTNSVRFGNTDVSRITGQVNFSSTSDRRFKENIQPIPLGIDFVNQLNPVEYIRKNNENGTKEWGIIAQELRETLQEAGHTDAGIVQEDADEDRTLSVRYTDLIAPVIKAIQELTVQNEELTSKIEELQSELNHWKSN